MANHKFIIDLSEKESCISSLTGGKASNLTKLIDAGFNVPDGFVVATSAYSDFMRENELGNIASQYLVGINYGDTTEIKRASESLRDKVHTASLSEKLVEEIKIAYSKLGNGPVAIRSSATAEDLPDASFAGQYDTSLNIKSIGNVIDHIKNCFGSLWTARAIAYRQENNIDHEKIKVAVVVQSMVDARCAGVMFTNNPLSTRKTEMMIESNFGLGESVVSGYAIPDRFVVEHNSNDPDSFSLISREIGTKDTIIEGSSNSIGVVQSKSTSQESQQSSLDDDEIVKLAEIGKSVENLFGTAQDIEWAIDRQGQIFLLQSRPITVDRKQIKEVNSKIFWTRGYSDDYWNDPVTPLFFSLLGDQITYVVNIEANAIMGYKNMPEELLKLYKGHVYFNLDVLKTKVINEMPPFIRSDDVMNYFPEGFGFYGKETMRKLPFAIGNRIMAEIRVMLLDADGSMTKTNDVYERWTKDTFIPACETFDAAFKKLQSNGTSTELMKISDDLDIVMMKHFRLVRYGLPVHTLGMNLITNYLLKRWLGEKAAIVLYPIMVSGIEHKTIETNRRIEEIASLIRKDDTLSNYISATSTKEIHRDLKSNDSKLSIEFRNIFADFIDDFGDRGFTREPYYSRWRDDPELVLDVIKALVMDHSREIKATENNLAKKRVKAEKFVEKIIRKQRYGPIKWMLFETILGMARTYTGFRENQRFNLDHWITRERNAYLEIGKRFVEQGYFDEPSHIFFLYRNEIRKILKNQLELSKESIKTLVNDRFEEFQKYENTTPPKFLQGEREFDDPLPDTTEGFKGIPASQGILTGHIRVLGGVDEVPNVKAGEILVVPRTDPGWTPVFSKIGGLITETGGILSHGAVVSREFGIPAVTNVRNACQIFRTGQKVTIDGNEGIVILHD